MEYATVLKLFGDAITGVKTLQNNKYSFAVAAASLTGTLLLKRFFANYKREKLIKERLRKGTRVVLTGCARGLGKQIAIELSHYGAELVLIDLRAEQLQETAELCVSAGAAKVHTIAIDLSTKENCEDAAKRAASMMGGIDIFWNNHAIFMNTLFEEYPLEKIDKLVQVDLLSPIYLAKFFLPHLKSSKGTFAITSSIAGECVFPYISGYCAVKHGLTGFFESIRLENEKHGVKVTLICPGGMDTEGYADLASERPQMNADIKLKTPQELAPEMVRAVGAGERTHYTEFALRAISFLRALFPVKIDHVINNIEKKN